MASKVLSIEINQIVTKICEMEEKSRNPRVYKSFMINTPAGVIHDGMLENDEQYVQALKSAFAAHKVKAKRVMFSISSTKIASREVTIPFVKESKVAEVIQAKAEEYFPVDLSNYKVSYTLLGTTGDEKNDKRWKALVLAVPLNLLQGYYDLAKACDLEIATLDYMGNSLFQAVKNNCVEGTQMVAKIDESSTLLIIMKDGAMISIRNVAYGVGDAIDIVRSVTRKADDNEWNDGHRDAIAEMREHLYIKEREQETGREIGAVVTEVTQTLDGLINGISRVCDFYNSKSDGHPIEKIYLTGVGGSFLGLSELMQSRLGTPVAVIKSIEGLTVPRDFHARNLGDYIACIGANIHSLDLTISARGKKEKKGGKAGEKDKGNSGVLILSILFAAALIAMLALTLCAMVPYKQAQLEHARLERRLEELKPVEEVRNTYLAAQRLWTDADNMRRISENHNDDLVAFVEELEAKMPTDIVVLSMAANADNVTLNIDTTSKEAAAKVLQQLDAFESIAVVSTAGLTDVEDSEGGHLVSFSVECVYTVDPDSEVIEQSTEPDLMEEIPADADGTEEAVE